MAFPSSTTFSSLHTSDTIHPSSAIRMINRYLHCRLVSYWDQMPFQYSFSMCTSFALGIYSESGEWPAVSFTRAIWLDLHCLSPFSLSLVYLEAQQISFHALLDIATSPDSPLRLTLISIITICFMPVCSVPQWGFTFPFSSFFV